MTDLGPRILHYRSADGREGEIRIMIIREEDTFLQIGDEPDPIIQPTFAITIDSDWFSWRKKFPSMDELQSIFRAMWMGDVYIRKICSDNGYEVFAEMPGDIATDYDTFKQ